MTAPDPSRSEDLLVGHDRAERAFRDAIRSGRLHHGWLITGPAGIGKATLALRVARYLLAGAPESDSLFIPSDHPVARRIESGGHADLIVVTRGMRDNGTPREEIVIDDVRRIEPLFRRTAGEGGWRIALIDEADRMNSAAQNAVLKILEEPPPGALVLLTAESAGRLLPTIRSRVRTIGLDPLDPPALQGVLRRLAPSLSEGELLAVSRLAEGSPGAALRLHQAEVLPLYRALLDLLGAPDRPSSRAMLDFADQATRKGGEEGYTLLTALWVRFLACVAKVAVGGLPVSDVSTTAGAEPETLTRLAATLGLERSLAVWDKVRTLFREADRLTLDRRQVVLSALFARWQAEAEGSRALP